MPYRWGWWPGVSPATSPPSALDEGGPRRSPRGGPQRHPCFGRRPVALALVAAATRGHGVGPAVPPAPGPGQDVVDGGRRPAAVRTPAPVPDQYAGAGPAGRGRVPPLGDDVLHQAEHLGPGEGTDAAVRLRLVYDGDLPAQHPDRVVQRHPVQRTEICV